jgi:acetyltransferase
LGRPGGANAPMVRSAGLEFPMHHYLRPLLAPQSVALVGASERPGSLGRTVYENLLNGGFTGELFAVNPHHRRILARAAEPTLAAIGRPVDLAIIATPPATVAAVIEQGARYGLRAAILMTAPDASDKATAQAWMRKVAAVARKRNVRLVGPGALGVIRTDIGLNATYCAPAALPGRLALVAQSGAVSAAMLDFAAPLRIGFSTVISLGGGIDVGFGELLDFLLLDTATDGILLYVEDPGDARAFLSALRAAARTKPVVVLKAGRSLESKREPTADAVFDAALTRAGTVRVQTYAQLFAAARILAMGRIPQGDRLAIVSNGRGPALLAADSAFEHGVALAKLAPETVAALDTILPHNSARANPIDVRGSASPARLAGAVGAALADPHVDAVIALHVARPAFGAIDSARAVADVARQSTKPVFGAWLGALDRREVDAALEAGTVANFYTPENAVEAFSFLAAYRRNQAWLLEVPPPQPLPEAPDLARAEQIRQRAVRAAETRLPAADVYALLAAFGIDTPPFVIVETLGEAEAAAKRLRFPVTLVLETDTPDAASPQRAVRSRSALAKAWGELHLAAPKGVRTVRGAHALVRRGIPSGRARTFTIAVALDRVFGPVIMLRPDTGAGGAALAWALMLPPLNRRLAADLVAEACPSTQTGRAVGANTAECDALQRALTQVSTLVCALPWVRSLVLNPVVISEGRAQAHAARIVVDPRKMPSPGYRHLAIHPYPVELVAAVRLRDGTKLAVRPIRPEDAELERAFVHGLSDQSRFFRFFHQLHELTPAMLARFTQVDYDRELAVVAVAADSDGMEMFVGVARYIANPDRESAEFAVVVADAWQHRGVARCLMERLMAAAKRSGLVRFEGAVLRANQDMLRFCAALGFEAHDDPEDPEQVVVEREL